MLMSKTQADSTRRFSNRVDNYVKYRPTYPEGVLDVLRAETGLTRTSIVADIGSGTGLSAQLFLEAGNAVYGVEPNQAMRAAAEKILQSEPKFQSVDGTAEATTLSDNAVDYVVAAQAFHWFDPLPTGREATRILKPNGWIVVMWNTRRLAATPFLQAYESILQKYGTDYLSVKHRNIDRQTLELFSGSRLALKRLYNEQLFDFQSLSGRLLSSSYAPDESHPDFKPMMHELSQIFEQHNQDGHVCFEYDTELYWGRCGESK